MIQYQDSQTEKWRDNRRHAWASTLRIFYVILSLRYCEFLPTYDTLKRMFHYERIDIKINVATPSSVTDLQRQ